MARKRAVKKRADMRTGGVVGSREQYQLGGFARDLYDTTRGAIS